MPVTCGFRLNIAVRPLRESVKNCRFRQRIFKVIKEKGRRDDHGADDLCIGSSDDVAFIRCDFCPCKNQFR